MLASFIRLRSGMKPSMSMSSSSMSSPDALATGDMISAGKARDSELTQRTYVFQKPRMAMQTSGGGALKSVDGAPPSLAEAGLNVAAVLS